MCVALDDTEVDAMVWMPAHTKESNVGQTVLGDGRPLTLFDRVGNEEADRLAKLGAKSHGVPEPIRRRIHDHNRLVEQAARWIARATWAAGHQTVRPLRDTESSIVAATAAARARAKENASPNRKRGSSMPRPVALRGSQSSV